MAERQSGESSAPHAGDRSILSTGLVAIRALWVVAHLAIGAVLWVPVVSLSTWAFHPDPKDPASGPLSQTVALGLVFTVVAVACALIPYATVNWLFRRFDKTLASKNRLVVVGGARRGNGSGHDRLQRLGGLATPGPRLRFHASAWCFGPAPRQAVRPVALRVG